MMDNFWWINLDLTFEALFDDIKVRCEGGARGAVAFWRKHSRQRWAEKNVEQKNPGKETRLEKLFIKLNLERSLSTTSHLEP